MAVAKLRNHEGGGALRLPFLFLFLTFFLSSFSSSELSTSLNYDGPIDGGQRVLRPIITDPCTGNTVRCSAVPRAGFLRTWPAVRESDGGRSRAFGTTYPLAL